MESEEKPDENDCCGTGCSPCILDVYANSKKLEKKNSTSHDTFKNVISPITYSNFKVAYIQRIHDYILLTFSFVSGNKINLDTECSIEYNSGQYFIIKAPHSNDNSTNFSRPYTPIKLSTPIFLQTEKNIELKNLGIYFQIIVKIYQNGLMSNYLKNLVIGDETIWRGPYGEYKYIPNSYKFVLMICQGTAIAPMFSIVDEILNNDLDETQIKLFYCCKSINDVVFREELYKMRLNWNFNYEVFLSNNMNFYEKMLKYKENINNRRLCEIDIERYFVNRDNVHVLIAGSENFMFDLDNIVKIYYRENIFLFK